MPVEELRQQRCEHAGSDDVFLALQDRVPSVGQVVRDLPSTSIIHSGPAPPHRTSAGAVARLIRSAGIVPPLRSPMISES